MNWPADKCLAATTNASCQASSSALSEPPRRLVPHEMARTSRAMTHACQTVCKPGSVRLLRAGATIPLGRISRCASRDQPGRQDGNVLAIIAGPKSRTSRPPLFGLAPGGVYPAAPVARGAVRSCRTVSPLPAGPSPLARSRSCTGGLFSVALSLGSPPPAVSRHRIPVEPGLSSTDGMTRLQRPPDCLAERDVRL
jgi:hypothetical protein